MEEGDYKHLKIQNLDIHKSPRSHSTLNKLKVGSEQMALCRKDKELPPALAGLAQWMEYQPGD